MKRILTILVIIPLLYIGQVLASKPVSSGPAVNSPSDLNPDQDKK